MFDAHEGFRPDVPGPDDESRYACPYLVHNELHLPWFEGFADGARSIVRDTLQRPSFFRTEAMPAGISASARFVIGEQSTPCPYCRQRFRNPNALRLHVEQAHETEFEWLFEQPRQLPLEMQLRILEQADALELTDTQQAELDHLIAEETARLRKKFLDDLIAGRKREMD